MERKNILMERKKTNSDNQIIGKNLSLAKKKKTEEEVKNEKIFLLVLK